LAAIEDVIRRCCTCGKEITLKAEDWKWWWEKGGKTTDIMLTSPVECDECGEDDEEDDDAAWRSEERLRQMEGWVC
jgi:DNA-directed RNA polymerase subunit RPC12/RpoP